MAEMAPGARLWKVIWSCALIVVMLAVGGVIFRDELSLEYHKRRLIAAKARHWRMTTEGYSFWDHVTEIVHGEPVSVDDVVATWKRHEEALVTRGFLKRQIFVAKEDVLPSRSSNPAYNEALARMEATCRWWSASRVETNLIVTACPKGLADWKLLAPKAGLISTEEASQTAEKPKSRCQRNGKKPRDAQTVAAI